MLRHVGVFDASFRLLPAILIILSPFFVVLGVKFILSGRIWWGICVLAPVGANTVLTMLLWWRFESGEVKKWSWILVLAQVWPQYKAARVIAMFWESLTEGDEVLNQAKIAMTDFQRGISTLEPFVESVPQVLNLSNILLKTSVIGTSINKAEATEDMRILTGNTRWLFFSAYAFSVLTASLGKRRQRSMCILIQSTTVQHSNFCRYCKVLQGGTNSFLAKI